MASILAALIVLMALSSCAISQRPQSSGSSGTVSATARTAPLTERERAIHLLSRATYGVRPTDLDEITRMGGDVWLEAQLRQEAIEIAPSVLEQAAIRDMIIPTSVPSALTHSKLARAAFSGRQLEEVMTDFWFNHFNIYIMKDLSLFMPDVRGRHDPNSTTIAQYEEHAIRAHVFGRFEDMLIATARHPAMLVYLDNYLSTIPNPDTVRGGGISENYARERLVLRGVGINENYARELLELHTLGVDGGYTQRDVIEVARAFTGWGVQTRTSTTANGQLRLYVNPGQTEMLFEPERHDQAAKTVMSLELPAGRGMEDGIDVLKMLAVHPSTAHHIATKLVTHFVSDRPPPELVAELTNVFLDTGGDLRAVTHALFSSDLFYDRVHYRAKTKRPFEFLVSALRVTGRGLGPWSAAPRTAPRPLHQLLQRMGHAPYMEPAPTGYPSVAEEWLGSNALLQRINFASDFTADQLEPDVTFEPFEALGLSISSTAAVLSQGLDGMRPEALPGIAELVTARLLPGWEVPELHSAIVRDLSQRTAAYPGGLLSYAIALTLGSPQFQRY